MENQLSKTFFCIVQRQRVTTDLFSIILTHLAIPDAQKCFFIRWYRNRLPYGPSDSGSFGIWPGESPFNATLRTFGAFGTQLRSEPGKTGLASNLTVAGTFHHFVNLHFLNSFEPRTKIPLASGLLPCLNRSSR
jgi:hypothetical protein